MTTTATATAIKTRALTPSQMKRARDIEKGVALAYDIHNYDVRGPVKVLHIDESSGVLVSSFGEGVTSVAICLRSMAMAPSAVAKAAASGSTATRYAGKIVVCAVYKSAKAPSASAQAHWILTPGQGSGFRASVGMAQIGSIVLDGSGINGFAPHLDSVIQSERAAFSAKIAAAILASASKR